ncbi:paraquat-inducible protein B [Nitrosomonas sp. Nm84]|uniref:MlaD family protein n=1 Tax=Nitrosomonas sp. Nm84 TaxID=200124 RepID=UPI000D763BDE|nr:MlaD family protein [Nitrosomonas sp. Nm84]PXW91124.1 paraquat-inducible protein B [Nitrosomonas sp. Nm84]
MSKQANPATIGLFVLGGFVLSIGIIILLSRGGFYQEKHEFVMYFDGSVNGLNVGAPVTMRGVQIGIIKRISLIHNYAKGQIIIPVVAEFYPGNIIHVDQSRGPTHETVKKLVEKFGLRAQLQTQSIITGQLYVQLDYHPGTTYKYYSGDDGDDETIEVPIIPSTLEMLEKRFEKLELSALVEDVSSAANAVSQLVSNPELNQSVRQLEATLTAMRSLVHSIDNKIIPLSSRIEQLLNGLQDTVSRIDAAAINVQELSDTESPTLYKFNTAMDELTRATRSMRTLTDMLENHPEVLIHGKKTGK